MPAALAKGEDTVSRTHRDRARSLGGSLRLQKRRASGSDDEFRCRRCKMLVGATLYGGRHRNHCPFCLYSRHVDEKTPGDRANDCNSMMAPIGAFTRPKGEHVIVHRCLGCGFERHNRVAADDSVALLMRLRVVPPRVASRRRDARPTRSA